MLDIFHYDFLTIAFVGAILSAASTSVLSVFISLKRVAFMGEALAHVSFAGVALALLLGFNLNVVTMVIVVLVALLIGFISKKYSIDESNITTIFLSVSMALAVILINIKKDFIFDISSYLFGNILLITTGDLYWFTFLLVANLLFLILFFKEIFYMTYNHEISAVFKIPVNLIYYLFLVFIAVNIVVSVKSVGVVLITAQLILPGIIALNLTKKIKKAILLAVIFSEISSISGFFISYYLDLPSGATIVLLLFALFLLSMAIKFYYQEFHNN